MAASKWSNPQTYEEVFEKWGPVIFKKAMEWGFNFEQARDLQAMVVEEFLLGQYLLIFDPKRAAFSTFWHSFVTKRLKRENSRRQRDPINYSVELDWSNEDGSLEERFQARVNQVVDPETRVVVRESLCQAVAALREIPPKKSKRQSASGRFRTRSLLVLFNMLGKGWARKDIANYWGVTPGTICGMVQELRQVPEVRDFREIVCVLHKSSITKR